jgi:hypothetical protein
MCGSGSLCQSSLKWRRTIRAQNIAPNVIRLAIIRTTMPTTA